MTDYAPKPAAKYLLENYSLHVNPEALITGLERRGKVKLVRRGDSQREYRMVSDVYLDQYVKERRGGKKSGGRRTGAGKGIDLKGPGSYQRRASPDKLNALAIVRNRQLMEWTADRVKAEVVVLRSGIYD